MNNSRPAPDKQRSQYKSFIPNLCDLQTVLFVILSIQVLAFVIALIKTQDALINWQLLGITSLLLHTIALSTCAVLCALRPVVMHRSVRYQASIAICTVISLSGIISWTSTQLVIGNEAVALSFIGSNMVVAGLLTSLVLRYFYLSYSVKQREKAELHSRIEALQSRIRPHFLFNSMNTIASLISSKPQVAEDAVLDLSELFRATLNTQNSHVKIRDELDLCRKYLNIESLRLGDRLNIHWAVNDAVVEYLIPPLTLQPIIENAIYHGIQPLAQGGTIDIEAYLKKGSIYLLVRNPVSEAEPTAHGNQIALANIADRLHALYAEQAILKTSKIDGIFTTTLRIPARKL